jgi:hypothetical protein
MKFRITTLVSVLTLLSVNSIAQIDDYQLLGLKNSTAPLINYLDQHGFREVDTGNTKVETSYYQGKYQGDYIRVNNNYNNVVFEMAWSVVDDAGNTIPERLLLGDMQFMPTYKENKKLHPSIFSDRKLPAEGVQDFVNFGLGESKVVFKFEQNGKGKNPKLIQIIMHRPNNLKQHLDALYAQKQYLKKLAVANIPEGTNTRASEVVAETFLYFKSVQSLDLKKDEIVKLDLPASLLQKNENDQAILLVVPTNTSTLTGAETFAHINFKVTTESGEYIGDSNSLEKARNSRYWITSAHKLSNQLDEKVRFEAEISMNYDGEVDVYYFEGRYTNDMSIHFSYATKDILEKRDYVPPYIDIFNRKLQAYKGRHGSVNIPKNHFLPASKRRVLYNDQFGSGLQHFLIKSEGKTPPVFKLDFESITAKVNNRATFAIDKDHESYRFEDGYHLFEFELKIDRQGWLNLSARNEANEAQKITTFIELDDPDSTLHHIELTPLMTAHTEDYFEIWRETTQRRVDKAMADMKSFGKKDEHTKDQYLNGVENRIVAALTAAQPISSTLMVLLDDLETEQNLHSKSEQVMNSFKQFKSHIDQATLYAIRAGCNEAYEILSNVQDDWFGYSGEAIQVDLANIENAINVRDSRALARWSMDYTKSMAIIANKLEKALLSVRNCR